MTTSWSIAPLSLYDSIYSENIVGATSRFIDIIKTHMNQDENKYLVPNLSANKSIDRIPDGNLVRLRGMVQDMMESEIFLSEYTKIDAKTQIKSKCSAKFRESETIENFQLDEISIKFNDRMSFILVPVPGETNWCREFIDSSDLFSSNLHAGVKRPYDLFEKQEVSEKSISTRQPSKRFPLAEEESKFKHATTIILRIYDNYIFDNLKVNDLVEVVGILEHCKLGSIESCDSTNAITDHSDTYLSPKVHVIYVNNLKHANPCFKYQDYSEESEFRDLIKMAALRNLLFAQINRLFCGDNLAAEYLICHIVSRITKDRSLNVNLDSFPALNIWGFPENNVIHLVSNVRQFLSEILPQLVFIKADIETFNKGPMLMPVRAPNTSVLQAGRLQLPNGTNVLVDETSMSSGQLDTRGVLNLQALALASIKFQLPFDFQTYQQNWDVDFRILILSTSQSLIKPVVNLCFSPSKDNSLNQDLSNDEKIALRNFVTACSLLGSIYFIEEDLQTTINQDFVNWRKNKETYIDVDEFSLLLNILKAYAVSHGRKNPTVDDWRTVVAMESERKRRNNEHLKRPTNQ